MRVVELTAEETHALRAAVLRDHLDDKAVDYESDRVPGTFHLGVRDAQGAVVAIATFTPEPAAVRPGHTAVRLLGMAVAPAAQRSGLGRAIVDEGLRRLSRDGIEVCWANARSNALDFYRSMGFSVIGDEFQRVGLPHRVVVIDLPLG